MANEIIEIAHRHEIETGRPLVHVNTMMGAIRYVEDALYIQKKMGSDKCILDLGCGVGQMSYILKRIGFNVIAADIGPDIPYYTIKGDIDYYCYNILEDSEKWVGKKVDAICLSGVLEHVSDFSSFLYKVRSILQRNGKLFIFRFPNRYSWIEKLKDIKHRNAVSHPLRFSPQEIDFMLRWHGFRVNELSYEEIFPVNMRGFPDSVRAIYHKGSVFLRLISRILCRIPILNKLSTSFRFVCTYAIKN